MIASPRHTTMNEYRVWERVVLRPGDRFRVTGGPCWRCGDGNRLAMAERGVLRFNRAIRYGSDVFIEARGQDGYCVLHVEGGRRNRVDPALVCRPYRIKARLRPRESTNTRR